MVHCEVPSRVDRSLTTGRLSDTVADPEEADEDLRAIRDADPSQSG